MQLSIYVGRGKSYLKVMFLNKEKYLLEEKDTNRKDACDEILRYKNLLDVGAMTQEEFDTKKKELLK